MTKTLTVATDGACSGNPGPAGWGFATSDGKLEVYGSHAHATNQQMELMAAAKALLALGRDTNYFGQITTLVVLSDSRYLVDGMNKGWYEGWERRNWKTSSGSPVKNLRTWKAIVKLTRAWRSTGVEVRFEWVKGHTGNALNEKADELAVKGKLEAKAAKAEAVKDLV